MGKQTFQRPTSADTMSAILDSDPAPLSPTLLRKHLLRSKNSCARWLENYPEQRFQSASDLAFALESLSDPTLSLERRSSDSERHPASSFGPYGGRSRPHSRFCSHWWLGVISSCRLRHFRRSPITFSSRTTASRSRSSAMTASRICVALGEVGRQLCLPRYR